MNVAFHRIVTDPSLSEYRVRIDGENVGTVSKRRGGWWSAADPSGHWVTNWARTRKECVVSLARSARLGEYA